MYTNVAMKENFKIPLIFIGILAVIGSINAMLSNQFSGAGILLLASAICFGILYYK